MSARSGRYCELSILNSDLWQPSASIEALVKRGQLFTGIRQFFLDRQVLEVDVPVLSQAAVSDPFIDTMEVAYQFFPGDQEQIYYLQSSPEYAMKRLLAAGSGCIYQMAKVFRNGEVGRKHNPEFTMLEWYRVGFDEFQLMDEVAALVSSLTGVKSFDKVSYHALFRKYLDLDISQVDNRHLAAKLAEFVEVSEETKRTTDTDGWLNLLMSHCIEPQLTGAVFVYNYPASQAALARVKKDSDGNWVAARFELFVDGVELANGYRELTDASEQQRRFELDQQQRSQLSLVQRPVDSRLVKALENGLPDCAGVALGVDRLMMLALGKESISQILPFDFSRA